MSARPPTRAMSRAAPVTDALRVFVLFVVSLSVYFYTLFYALSPHDPRYMLLSNVGSSSRRASVNNAGPFNLNLPDLYSDAREHGYNGPTRHVRLPRATNPGGGAIAKGEDGMRCVVAGRECKSHPPSRALAPLFAPRGRLVDRCCWLQRCASCA